MNERPWGVFHSHFPTLKPPLASVPEVAGAIAASIAGHTHHGLLLGVTPNLARLCDRLTAVDWSADMIARVWPGDSEGRRAVEADWRDMPMAASSFTAAIGDGSFNCLDYPHDYVRVFAELERVLAPGARVAVRFFTAPTPADTLGDIRRDALAGRVAAIDALKWRLAMAVAARSGDANVARGAIHAAFEETFADREALLVAAGWQAGDLAGIDWYKGVADTISFPTRDEILKTVGVGFGDTRFAEAGDYELADRCPILIMERKS